MITDEKLWLGAVEGDAAAEEELIRRYQPLVRACARPFFLAGADSEDLLQEGLLGLLRAVRHYSPDGAASFKTYAEKCIRNSLYSAVKSASSMKHLPLNDAVSINSPDYDDGLAATGIRDLENAAITASYFEDLLGSSGAALSEREKAVLSFYLEGYSYVQIAEKLGIGVKSVDNAIQRIRKKLISQAITA